MVISIDPEHSQLQLSHHYGAETQGEPEAENAPWDHKNTYINSQRRSFHLNSKGILIRTEKTKMQSFFSNLIIWKFLLF